MNLIYILLFSTVIRINPILFLISEIDEVVTDIIINQLLELDLQ